MVNSSKKYRLFGQEVVITPDEVVKLRERLLTNYVYLQDQLRDVSEDECFKALCLELDGKRRPNVCYRLHAKFADLRTMRERFEQNLRKV